MSDRNWYAPYVPQETGPYPAGWMKYFDKWLRSLESELSGALSDRGFFPQERWMELSRVHQRLWASAKLHGASEANWARLRRAQEWGRAIDAKNAELKRRDDVLKRQTIEAGRALGARRTARREPERPSQEASREVRRPFCNACGYPLRSSGLCGCS